MTAPMDAPDWLVELLGEHIQTWEEGHNAVRSGCSCGVWHASFVVVPQPYSPLYKDVAIKHRAHVAAVVWAAITERVEAHWSHEAGHNYTLDALEDR